MMIIIGVSFDLQFLQQYSYCTLINEMGCTVDGDIDPSSCFKIEASPNEQFRQETKLQLEGSP